MQTHSNVLDDTVKGLGMSLEPITGRLQTKTSRFEWKIDRFLADCEKMGDYHDSPTFTVQFTDQIVTNWQLRIFPKGYDEESKDHVSVQIYLFEEKVKVNMDCEFIMLRKPNVALKKKFMNLSYSKPVRGWRWAVMPAIRIPGTLIDDTVTVVCEITFHPTVQDDASFLAYSPWLNAIISGFGDFEQLLESGSMSDMTLTVQNKTINLHKAILSCRSPVFKAMLEHQMKENESNNVEITDIDHDVMMEMLRFLYSGKVKNIENIASDLLIAASKYHVIELKALCESTLHAELTEDNAVRYLNLVEMCNTLHLKRLVIDYVAANYKVIIRKSGFEDLSNKIMFLILVAVANLDKSAPK